MRKNSVNDKKDNLSLRITTYLDVPMKISFWVIRLRIIECIAFSIILPYPLASVKICKYFVWNNQHWFFKGSESYVKYIMCY